MDAASSIAPAAAGSVPWVLPLLIGAAVLLMALGLSAHFSDRRGAIRRRLSALGESAAEGPDGEAPSQPAGFAGQLRAAVGNFGGYLLPTQGAERQRVENLLRYAGFRQASAMPVYYGIKLVLMVALAALVLLSARFFPTWPMNKVYFAAFMAGAIGLVAPGYLLEYLAEERQRRLRNAFPDALDMLVICVEAGLGLAAAIQRVGEELRFSHPELGHEFTIVNAEMRAGVDRETALMNLTERTGLEDVRGLVSLLVQTMRFGTGVADTLRVYSEEFRDRRMQRAEELAAKIGTKLIFPLVLCLFPAFFVVAIGPAVLRLVEVFGQLGQNLGQ